MDEENFEGHNNAPITLQSGLSEGTSWCDTVGCDVQIPVI